MLPPAITPLNSLMILAAVAMTHAWQASPCMTGTCRMSVELKLGSAHTVARLSILPLQTSYQTYIPNNGTRQAQQMCTSGTMFGVAAVSPRHHACQGICSLHQHI